MEFDEYQEEAAKTAVYPNIGNNLTYATLGLCGEAGETAEKVKKLIRDRGGKPDRVFLDLMLSELGDVLWYLAAVARELGLSLDNIAAGNIAKLKSRQERNVLHGDGDNR